MAHVRSRSGDTWVPTELAGDTLVSHANLHLGAAVPGGRFRLPPPLRPGPRAARPHPLSCPQSQSEVALELRVSLSPVLLSRWSASDPTHGADPHASSVMEWKQFPRGVRRGVARGEPQSQGQGGSERSCSL